MSNRPYKWTGEYYAHTYGDIIHLSRPAPRKHQPMPMEARAAQFSPYDALTGYSDEIRETARTTDKRPTLSPEEKDTLNTKISMLADAATAAGKYGVKPTVTLLCFIPDKKKDGGNFHEVSGAVRIVDLVNREIVLAGEGKSPDGHKVKLEDVVDITGDMFDGIALPAE